MCGIFGFTKYTEQAQRMAPFLAAAMEERGEDSYGLAWYDTQINVRKDVGPISQAFYTKSLFTDLADYPIVAHTRAASHGEVIPENAHPFVFTNGSITLAGTHNGVVTNFHEHAATNPELTVDSQLIWKKLINHEDMHEVEGWGSCAAIITTPHPYMIFFRFNHQALFFVDLPDGAIAYASTEEALKKASRFACGEELSPHTIDKDTLYAVDLVGDVETLVPVTTLHLGVRGVWHKKKAACATPWYLENDTPNDYWGFNQEYRQYEARHQQPVKVKKNKKSRKKLRCIRCHRAVANDTDLLCVNCIETLNNALIDAIIEGTVEEEHGCFATAGN